MTAINMCSNFGGFRCSPLSQNFEGKPNLESLCRQFMFSVFKTTTITLSNFTSDLHLRALLELGDVSVPDFSIFHLLPSFGCLKS